MECRVVGEGTSGTRLLQLRERGPAAVNARVKCVCVCVCVFQCRCGTSRVKPKRRREVRVKVQRALQLQRSCSDRQRASEGVLG